MNYTIKNTKDEKILSSENLNMYFNKNTGFTITYGKTKDIDPDYSPFGPFIADIEITTSCSGSSGELCKFCYKSNNPNGKNMSFETFKTIFDKLPDTMTQIAFGADASCEANPDIWKMMEYCRANNVVPNITVADITEETAIKLAQLCGAVAVSHYQTDTCKRSIALLHKHGLKQINVHQMISEETLDKAYDILDASKDIPGLNAIVMLSLKQKGRGRNFTPLSYHLFKDMIDYAMANKIPMGFDSCTAHKFLKYVNESDNEQIKKLAVFVEPCESMLFSTYIDVDGMVFPCSFSPDTPGWGTGIDLVSAKDYMDDVWNSERMVVWREGLISNGRRCPLYNI
jgi:MoaA/NifB/PqqE/SkfB family radical SAM enzyme